MSKLLYLIIFLILYECSITFHRKYTRRVLFEEASKRAKETNKKLLVIGDPYNGIASISTGLDYNCGDLCIDLTGCPKCKNGIKGYLENVIKDINMNDYVVYISCVLEYVDDIEEILKYLNRIDFKDLFIVTVEYYSLGAYLYPYFITKEKPPQNIIYQTKPKILYYKNPFIIN